MNASFLIAEYRRVREGLLAQFPELAEDETALADTVDGETGALDAVASLIRQAIEDDAYAAALSDIMKDQRERKARFEARAETRRRGAMALMEAIGQRKLERPEFTASIRQTGPKVEVLSEADIPDDYCRHYRTPDKTAIKGALERGEEVPGAVLGNGGVSISVRTK